MGKTALLLTAILALLTACSSGLTEADVIRIVQNEPGLQGPTGPVGAQGGAGPEGPRGIEGRKGDKGAQGDRGEQGVQGERGLQGQVGPPGADGTDGEKGAPGDQGPKGSKGDRGPKGDKGDQGPQGEQGPMGEQGLRGLQGAPGPEGGSDGTSPSDPYRYLSSKGSYVVDFTTDTGGDWDSCGETVSYSSTFGIHHRSHHIALPSEADTLLGMDVVGYYPGWTERRICAGDGGGIEAFTPSWGVIRVSWAGTEFSIVGVLKKKPDMNTLFEFLPGGAFYLIDTTSRKYVVFGMDSARDVYNNEVTFDPLSWNVLRQNFATEGSERANLIALSSHLTPSALAYKRIVIAFSSDTSYVPYP